MDQLLIIGAGGHGRVVADIARLTGRYQHIAFADDADISSSGGYPVICKTEEAAQRIGDWDMVVAIGNNAVRKRLSEQLAACGARLATLIHPTAVVAAGVPIGPGSVVMANAVINCGSTVGKGVIVNTAATVDHDNVIGDYVHISPGVHLGGTVTVGNEVWLCIGAAVSNNLSICDGCVIGAGAVVIKNIAEPATYSGVPTAKHQRRGHKEEQSVTEQAKEEKA